VLFPLVAYFNGLFLGFSLIFALGPQNVFLIKQGARKNHALLSAIICFLCDLILICASITSYTQSPGAQEINRPQIAFDADVLHKYFGKEL
jgi:arginine exporter protein ArgO